MMEISTTEHQPEGTVMNPNFAKTFDCFFREGYRAFTADAEACEIKPDQVQQIVTGQLKLTCHNFFFRE